MKDIGGWLKLAYNIHANDE